MTAIQIGKKHIGIDSPCFLIAEVGINHNGELELAKKMIIAAAESGADAVKFQNYRTEDFLQNQTLTYTYKTQGREVTESQWDMFKRCEPRAEWWPEIKALCDKLSVIFFSTPTGKDGVDQLTKLGVPLLKNGSDYLTHLPLLEYMSSTAVPLLVSTGMANQQEVDDAVAAVRRGGKSPLILLHCTSAYPTPLRSTNLRRMVSLQKRYGVPIGFSDHTEGDMAACQAVTLGACVIEKHFTLDHNLPGPDHHFSSTPEEFSKLVQEVRNAEKRLGEDSIAPANAESEGRNLYRLGAIATVDIPRGAKLSEKLIAFRRPGIGLSPKELSTYLDKSFLRDVAAGEYLRSEDFSST